MTQELQPVDWAIVGAYLVLVLVVGTMLRKRAGTSKESYFLADRSLPWWWAGASLAATTFAADTPLAVTGIIAERGFSGNWVWLSWLGVHAGVVVLFATMWNRSRVLTDAELVALRYSGRGAKVLRALRTGLYGLVFNCIILGWVLKAMVKIVTPFFHWDVWMPGVVADLSRVLPALGGAGGASDMITIAALVTLVGFYSGLGGIRGVILTDLFQLAIALVGSFWLAIAAWSAVGGAPGLSEGLTRLYGAEHRTLDFFPSGSGWFGTLEMGALAFGMYLVVQSYANMPGDGGGYLMQRLNTTPNAREASRASLFFLVLQYLVRTWPWFVVGAAALVLIPLGGEATALGGAGAIVANDRELAYPVLMGHLLPPAALGLVLMSLLAAFMSTVDTHINWGASYVVNDMLLVLRPHASRRTQLAAARGAVVVFALLAVIVSFQIDTIAQAWQWVAALGAALGLPTMLRWVWWRVNAAAELGSMIAGITTAVVLAVATDLSYESRLIITAALGFAGMMAGILLGPQTDPDVLRAFVKRVHPMGFWPGSSAAHGARQIALLAGRWALVVGGVIGVLLGTHRALFFAQPWAGLVWLLFGSLAIYAGARGAISRRGGPAFRALSEEGAK